MFQGHAMTQSIKAKIRHFKEIALYRAKDSSTFHMYFESAMRSFVFNFLVSTNKMNFLTFRFLNM